MDLSRLLDGQRDRQDTDWEEMERLFDGTAVCDCVQWVQVFRRRVWYRVSPCYFPYPQHI